MSFFFATNAFSRWFFLLLCFNLLFLSNLYSQDTPLYLSQYTITKIYFEGGEELNRYYIFRFLKFQEGDTLTPTELQQRLADSRYAMRTQWYFQANFETYYYADGRVEIFVLLEPTQKRLAFTGATPDEHSVYISFIGVRKISPGSAFRFQLGKSTGISWYFPHIQNSFFGMNILAEVQTQKLLERLDLTQLDQTIFWLRGGIEELIEPSIPVSVGFSQKYWGILDLNNNSLSHDIAIGTFIDLNWLYWLKSRKFGMQFRFQFDAGLLTGLLAFNAKYKLALLPIPRLELNLYLSAVAHVLQRLAIGALDPEVPETGDAFENEHDFYALGRLRSSFLFSQNDYDNRTEFNFGLALEAKLGLSARIFQLNTSQPFELGVEIQGGFLFDVLTPGAFTTRFYFLTGFSLTQNKPTAEFLIEARF